MQSKLQQVIDKVASLGFCWWQTPEGKVRTRRSLLDPIAALYVSSTGIKTIRLSNFEAQGNHLGLSRADTLAIVLAADNDPSANPTIRQYLLEKLTPP